MIASGKIGVWFSWLGAAIGLTAFGMQWFGAAAMTAVLPERPQVMPVTAVGLTLAGLSAALRFRENAPRVFRVCSRIGGVLVFLAGSVTLLEYGFDVELGIDWTLGASITQGPHPGRASPLTAFGNVALGAALMLFDVRPRGRFVLREALALAVAFFAFVSLVGHIFGATRFYRLSSTNVTGVALPTGIALLLLGGGVLFARPGEGLARLFVSRGPGGVTVRRLGLATAVVGPALGALLLWGVRAAGVRDVPLLLAGAAVIAASLAMCASILTAFPLERAHEALGLARDRVAQVLAQAPDAVFVADIEGHYTEVNEAGCRMLGFSRAELLTMTVADVIPPEDQDRLAEAREGQLRGAVQRGRWALLRKDGSRVPVELSAHILPDGSWQAFIRDVTERVNMERELVESRDFLRGVLESATGYAIVAKDVEGRIVLWNEGAKLAFGYAASEVLGAPCDMLVMPEDVSLWRALRATAVATGKAEGSIRARRRDGSEFSMQAVLSKRVGDSGQPVGLLVVGRDLTSEQRQLAEQEFLARVGVELAACLEPREVLTAVSRLATDHLGELCIVDVIHDGVLERATVRHKNPSKAQLAVELAQLTPGASANSPVWHVLPHTRHSSRPTQT